MYKRMLISKPNIIRNFNFKAPDTISSRVEVQVQNKKGFAGLVTDPRQWRPLEISLQVCPLLLFVMLMCERETRNGGCWVTVRVARSTSAAKKEPVEVSPLLLTNDLRLIYIIFSPRGGCTMLLSATLELDFLVFLSFEGVESFLSHLASPFCFVLRDSKQFVEQFVYDLN